MQIKEYLNCFKNKDSIIEKINNCIIYERSLFNINNTKSEIFFILLNFKTINRQYYLLTNENKRTLFLNQKKELKSSFLNKIWFSVNNTPNKAFYLNIDESQISEKRNRIKEEEYIEDMDMNEISEEKLNELSIQIEEKDITNLDDTILNNINEATTKLTFKELENKYEIDNFYDDDEEDFLDDEEILNEDDDDEEKELYIIKEAVYNKYKNKNYYQKIVCKDIKTYRNYNQIDFNESSLILTTKELKNIEQKNEIFSKLYKKLKLSYNITNYMKVLKRILKNEILKITNEEESLNIIAQYDIIEEKNNLKIKKNTEMNFFKFKIIKG